MQVVVKDKKVVATHPDHVTLPSGAYPGAEVVLVPGPERGLNPGDLFDPKERPVAAKETEARAKRDKLLAASDWTQLPDSPLTEATILEWKVYRQALRDLNMTDPDKLVWPTPPATTARQI